MSAHTVSSSAAATPPVKPYSCQLCQQRKVKCDRGQPCHGCTKAGVECEYRPPAPPRRRKKRSTEDILRARLRKCEEMLKNLGVTMDGSQNGACEEADETAMGASRTSSEPIVKTGDIDGQHGNPGRLLVADGKSRYLENALWSSLGDELSTSSVLLDSSSHNEDSADETEASCPLQTDIFSSDVGQMMFDLPTTRLRLSKLHPEPVKIFNLWQKFLENIDPLTKVLHTPTVQQQVLKASANVTSIPKSFEALIFAIYLSAVASLSEEECLEVVGEPRKTMLKRFNFGTQHALINADFIQSPDLVVLQALTLYLLAMRPLMEAQKLWVLSGVALRIAQRIGLHHDGASLKLSVFETEMRRRLWWQIIVIDGFSAELSGVGLPIVGYYPAIPLPLNVNDSDLNPNMREAPPEHSGITEMSFSLVRYHFGQFLQNSAPKRMFDGAWQLLTSQATSVADKMKQINDLEKLLEDKILQYCDLSIPFHFIISMVGRCAITMTKHRVYTMSSGLPDAAPISNEERDQLFANSIKITEYDNLSKTIPDIRRYYWHVEAHFQWHAFIFLLYELQKRTSGADVENAWFQVEKVYENRREFLSNNRNKLIEAVGNLVLKAWEQRVLAARSMGTELHLPEFINALQSQRSSAQLPKQREYSLPTVDTPLTAEGPHISPAFSALPITPQPAVPAESPAQILDFGHSIDQLCIPELDGQPPHMSPNWLEWEALFRDTAGSL